MNFKDALAKARASRPEPKTQDVVVGGELFSVEIMRLDGMEWAGVTSQCPPTDETGARLGFDTKKAALVACRGYSRLLNAAGDVVDMAPVEDKETGEWSNPWGDLFSVISGIEVDAIAATWWAMNVLDPNTSVVALKKALAAGGKTS